MVGVRQLVRAVSQTDQPGALTKRTKSVFAGDTEDSPTIRVPSYFIEILSPTGETGYRDMHYKLTRSTARERSPESYKSITQAKELLRSVLTGVGSSETKFDNLDVHINTTLRRWKRSRNTTVKIFNPSVDKVSIIKRGSAINILMGWKTKTIRQSFYGLITKVEQEWESSGDFYLKLTCMQYEEAVMNNATYYSPDDLVEGKPLIPLVINLTVSSGTTSGGYYDALYKLVNVHLSRRAQQAFGIPLTLDINFRNIIKLREVTNSTAKPLYEPPSKNTITMAEILDNFFKVASPGASGSSSISWWVDQSGTVRFPFKENVEREADGKVSIGDNAFKVSIISDSPDIPEFTGQNISLPIDSKQDVRLVVHMVGRSSTRLGNLLTVDEAFSEGVIDQLEKQASNFGLEEFKTLNWIVDQIDHNMDSEKEFVTKLVLVQPGTINETTGASVGTRSSDGLNAIANLKKEIMDHIKKEMDTIDSREKFALFTLDGTGGTTTTMRPALVPGSINEDEPPEDSDIGDTEAAQFSLFVTATSNDQILTAPVDADRPIEEYKKKVPVNTTSPWAVEFKDPLSSKGNFYGAGTWYPISTHGMDTMKRRAIIRTMPLGGTYMGLSHWASGMAPLCYQSDWMRRTPARSVDLIPTENRYLSNGKLETDDGGVTDAGTRTQIFKQYLIDANSLIDGRVKGIISRPKIKEIMASTGNTGTADDDIVFMVSNKNRTVTTKIIIRQSPAGHDSKVVNDAAPEIHIILDDRKSAGSRQEIIMTNTDGSSPKIEVHNAATKIVMDESVDHKIVITAVKGKLVGDLDVTGIVTGGAT